MADEEDDQPARVNEIEEAVAGDEMDAIDGSGKSMRKGKGKKKKKRKSKASLLSSPTASAADKVSPSPSPASTSGSKKRERSKGSKSKDKKPRPSLDEEDDQRAPVNDIEEAVGVETEEALEAVAGDEMDATDDSPEPENSKRKGKRKKKEKRKSKALLLSSPTATVPLSKESTSPASTSGSKKRARPKVSKDKKSCRSLAFEETIDDDFTHLRLVVNPGEDLVEVMEKFNRQYKCRNVCIISVGGFASKVVFEDFSYDTSALPDEEQMQLLSLSVGRIFKGNSDSQNPEENRLTASLLNGKVIGGTLVGPLIAARASPIHIIVGTSKRTTGESSTANQNINLASEDVGVVQEDAGVVAGTDDQTIQQPEIDPNNNDIDEEDDQQAFVKPIKEALEEVTEEDAVAVAGDEMDATDDSPEPEKSKRREKGKKKEKRKSKALLLSSPTAAVPLSKVSTSPTSAFGSKKRGRPKVSKDKKPRSSLAFKEKIDDDFTHHRLVVNPGEDLVKVMDKFLRQYKRRNVCIISVSGSASKVEFEINDLYPLRYEEQMQLLSLSVGRIFKGDGDSQNTEEIKLNASLSRFTKSGTVIGGTLVGPLIAASPIQIIVGTFKRIGAKNKIIFPGESSTANQYLNLASEEDGRSEQEIFFAAMLLRLFLEAQMSPDNADIRDEDDDIMN